MKPSLSYDPQAFQAMMRELGGIKKFGTAEILTYVGKMLVNNLFAATPPFGKNTFREGIREQKAIGKKAIEKDYKKVFKTTFVWAFSDLINRIPNRRAMRYARKYYEASNTDAVRKILIDVGVAPSSILQRANAATGTACINFSVNPHRQKRMFIVTDASSIQRAVEDAASRLFTAKAGWVRSALALGMKIPANILKQAGRASGSVEDQRFKEGTPFLEFVNTTTGAAALDIDVVNVAMAETQRSGLEKQIAVIMNKRIGIFNSGGSQPSQIVA